MEYEGRVPAARIRSKNLKELENILLKDCKFTGPLSSREISISFGNFSEESNTVKRFLKDPTLPKEIRDFSWRIHCEERSIWLRTDAFGAKVTISGPAGWVKEKKENINAFLKKHKNLSRKISNYPPLMYAIMMFGMILFFYSAKMISSGFQIHWGFLLLSGVFLTVFGSVQFIGERKKFVPYLTIELEEVEKYRWKENFLVAFLASIISTVALILIMSLLT